MMVEASIVNLVELGVLVVGVIIAIQQLRDIKQTRETELETRQAQLFMQIYNSLREEKFQNYLMELRQWKAKDYDEMMEKYGKNPDAIAKMNYVTSFFEGVGVLVEEGLLDIKLVYNLISTFLFNYWLSMPPEFFKEFRIRANRPKVWSHTELLYNKMMELYIEEVGHEYSPNPDAHAA